MGLDIRLPIGLLFLVLGVLLAGYGLVSDPEIYRASLGINVNLGWGLVMLVFGAIMFYYGRRGTAAMRSAEVSLEGRRMEEREQRSGLERPGH